MTLQMLESYWCPLVTSPREQDGFTEAYFNTHKNEQEVKDAFSKPGSNHADNKSGVMRLAGAFQVRAPFLGPLLAVLHRVAIRDDSCVYKGPTVASPLFLFPKQFPSRCFQVITEPAGWDINHSLCRRGQQKAAMCARLTRHSRMDLPSKHQTDLLRSLSFNTSASSCRSCCCTFIFTLLLV